MANQQLNLSGDYATEMLAYYLYGQSTRPEPSELVSEKWLKRDSASIGWVENPTKKLATLIIVENFTKNH